MRVLDVVEVTVPNGDDRWCMAEPETAVLLELRLNLMRCARVFCIDNMVFSLKMRKAGINDFLKARSFQITSGPSRKSLKENEILPFIGSKTFLSVAQEPL